jgi:hypothetical protein
MQSVPAVIGVKARDWPKKLRLRIYLPAACPSEMPAQRIVGFPAEAAISAL